MPVWDITEQPVRDQFEYWHDVICDVFVPMTPQRTVSGEGFASLVESRALGTVNRTDVRSQPQRTVHGQREVDSSNGAFYFVNLQLAGRCWVRQGDREAVVSPGQLAVVDTTQPYYLDFDSAWRMVTYRVPHKLLSSRLANPRAGTVVPINGGRGIGGVASAMMRSMWDLDERDSADGLTELEQSFATLVSVAMSAAGDRDESPHTGLRVRVLRYLAANLSDPGLSVTAVCRQFAISPRLLHKLFEGQEQTFAQTVRALRLHRCARLLADPSNSATITEIALRHGFTDSSSFSRAFRRHFGMPPRQLRARGGVSGPPTDQIDQIEQRRSADPV